MLILNIMPGGLLAYFSDDGDGPALAIKFIDVLVMLAFCYPPWSLLAKVAISKSQGKWYVYSQPLSAIGASSQTERF